MNLHNGLNTPKYPSLNARLNQPTQKKLLAKFSYPKKIPESKISNPKKSFDHPRHLKSGVPPPRAISTSQFFYFSLPFFFLVTESNILYHEDISSTSNTVRQHVFIKNEFYYLNVPRVGAVTVYDVFDCTFECLSNPLCFSVNLAASKGAHGKLWCELLSSDKYRNSTEYKGNQSSHHFAIKVGKNLSNL